MKKQIVRKDGIVYERKPKKLVYNVKMDIKITEKLKEDLDTLAEKQGKKRSKLIRDVLEDYIKENME